MQSLQRIAHNIARQLQGLPTNSKLLIGSLMIGLINNGLILMGLESSQQIVIRGAIIVVAVALASRK